MAETQQIDMRILAKAAERKFTLGIVYEPAAIDTDGEFAKAEDIESAAHAFMERLQAMSKSGAEVLRAVLNSGSTEVTLDITDMAEALEKGAGLDDMHLQVGDEDDLGTIVESYIAPVDMEIGAQTVKKGAWLLGVIWSDAMWKKIKAGKRTGLSMYGSVGRIKNQPVEA